MLNPFDALRRDLERISWSLGPHLLPTTFQVGGRTFILGYTELKESPGVPGNYIAESQLLELEKGVVGGVTVILTPQTRESRIDYAYVTDRRKGIGSTMVRSIERDVADRGYRRITLNAVADSIPFWQGLGYRAEGVPDKEGALEMSKRI